MAIQLSGFNLVWLAVFDYRVRFVSSAVFDYRVRLVSSAASTATTGVILSIPTRHVKFAQTL